MNRRIDLVFFGTLVFLVLVITGTGIAANAATGSEHFPLLKRSLAEKGQGNAVDSESLLRELKIERALWLDEVKHNRKVLAAAGSGQVRLDEADLTMRNRFEEIEQFIRGGSPLSAETRETLDGRGGPPHSWPSGPLSMTSVLPEFEHRTPRFPEVKFPEGYGEPPSGELRSLVSGRHTAAKVGFEPDRPDLVRNKVGELGGDPMALYSFVLNEIRPAFSKGLMRGPDSVLRSGEGNDAEQASLLAALFREAGYPARVAWGIQEIGIESLYDHYGADDFRSLESTLTNVGLGWEPVLSGGAPAGYRLERVWCEVWLPFGNFRGVVLDASGATWVTLDPYLKNLEENENPTILERMNFDQDPWIDRYLAGTDCTAPLSEAGACPAPRDLFLDEVAAFLESSVTTIEEAVTPPRIRKHSEPILPTAMGGKIIAVSGVDVDLPEALRHRIRMVAKDGVLTLFDGEFSVADMVGKETVIWFVPATPDDEMILAAYGGELWRVPPYLINVTPELRIDGAVVHRGVEGIGMGRTFEWEYELTTPGGDSTGFVNAALAGVPTGLGLAPGLSGYRPVFGEPSNTLELLSSLASSWLDGVGEFEGEMAALAGGAVIRPFPNMVSVASVMRVESSLGLIEGMEWLGVSVDADVHASRLGGEVEARRQWLEMVELDASARERLLFEEDYLTPSISADKALMLAVATGVTIHHIDNSNLGAILPTLPFDVEVLDEIEGWVLAGGEAWVPAEELQTLEWSGVGYRLWDPETGESRYQLAGRLSGGMTAAPPFEVVEGLRDPLQYPSPEYVNTDPSAAVYVEIFDGDLQIGQAGDDLSQENDAIPLRVRVFDVSGRPVRDATVEFQVLGGGGGFGAPGVGTISVTSNAVGIAETVLTLGEHTSDNPYYLLFPDDEHSTRCGLTVVTASVNGFGMSDVFWEMASPGDLNQLLTPRGTSVEALPHLSAGSLWAVPADQYENPISNVEVTYVLNGGASSEPNEGPVLLGRDEKEQCRAGIVVAGECPGGAGAKTEIGGVTGTWVYLVIGEDDVTVTATATTDEGTANTTFSGHSRTEMVPGYDSVGWPTLLVSRRGQPENHDGEIIEAYPPGHLSHPLQVSLFIVRQNYSVGQCDGDASRYCTSPLGTFTTIRVDNAPVAGCWPGSCGGADLSERGQVLLSGAGQSILIEQPDADGNFTRKLTLPTTPGRYEIMVTPTVWVSVPKQPDNADYWNEVEPCFSGDSLCGAKLGIREVSDPNWRTSFVLWSVRAEVTDPPLVKLGHGMLHEEASSFPFTIEPPNYPAMNTVMFFLEDGQIRLMALAEGGLNDTVILPAGRIFGSPEGPHKVGLFLNHGWVWHPFPGEAVSMVVESEQVDFPVVMVDVDIDSNNDNGSDPLESSERSDAEDSIEAGGPAGSEPEFPNGKVLFVNHDDSDDDGIPDYADLEVAGERSMVPLVVEVRPEENRYEDVTLTFRYDGPARSDVAAISTVGGVSLGEKSVYDFGQRRDYEYRDYTAHKVGALRIWNIDQPTDLRDEGLLVVGDEGISASSLGFDENNPVRTFWVEAINGAGAGDALSYETISVEVSLNTGGSSGSVEDTVVVFPIEGNLGVNNSNPVLQQGGNPVRLRPGVPDENFDIDEFDEMTEDQGDGYRIWGSETHYIALERIEDLSPLLIQIPQELIDADFSFGLNLRSEDGVREALHVLKLPDGASRLDHLRVKLTAENLVDAQYTDQAGLVGVPYRTELDYLTEAETELVFLAVRYDSDGDDQLIHAVSLDLLAGPPGTPMEEWLPVDSVRLTVAPIESFFSAYSTRGDNDSGDDATTIMEYPIETIDGDFKRIWGPRFPLARHVDGSTGDDIPETGIPNPDVKPFLVWLHGYNVPFGPAIDWGRVAFKRLYWVGYRGNLILFTWKGDPPGATGFAHFGLANQWALQTSESLRLFLREGMPTTWQVPAEKIHVLGHSLGNLVVYDAMRLDRAKGNSDKLFHNFISSEAAIWGETLWPQAPVEYCPGIDLFCQEITYSVRELQCSSWTFWFNQQGQEAWKAVNRIYHTYSPDDNVLTLVMRESDRFARQFPASNPHYYRPTCSEDDDFRVPWTPTDSNGNPDTSIWYNPQLAFGDSIHPGCPAMLDLDDRMIPYSHLALEVPAGATSSPLIGNHDPSLTLTDVNARGLGWDDSWSPTGGHSNLKTEVFPEIFDWWEALVSDNGALPKGKEF